MLRLFFGNIIDGFRSWRMRVALRTLGATVGRRVSFGMHVDFQIDAGQYAKIAIGNDVVIRNGVEFWTRGEGRIVVEDGARIDRGCRLLAARSATLRVGPRARIGVGTIINAGADVTIREKALIAGYCYIQASDHSTEGTSSVADGGHDFEPIVIGEGAWLAANAIVLKGVTIGKGAIVAAGAVVNSDAEDNAIVAGVPARTVKHRGSNP